MLEAFPFKLYAFILQVAIHAANHMQDSLLVLHRFINPRVITPSWWSMVVPIAIQFFGVSRASGNPQNTPPECNLENKSLGHST